MDSFDSYNTEMMRMYVGEWIKFCKDFELSDKKHDNVVSMSYYTLLYYMSSLFFILVV